jgi:stage II sporulation protein D
LRRDKTTTKSADNSNVHRASAPALFIFVLVLMASACGPVYGPTPAMPSAVSPALPRTIRIRTGNRVMAVPFEEYVAVTSLAEVTPVTETAAVAARVYDVQTIVARTYAFAHLGRHRADGFDLCDLTHCQLYEPGRLTTSRFAAEARRAAERTAGRVLLYGARPIDALFHADCGGHTSTPELVWGSAPRSYLRAAADAAPDVTHRTWRLSLTRDELRKALNLDARTSVGESLSLVSPGPIDASGRVTSVTIDGTRRKVVKSDDFRAVVNRTFGARALQSTRFSLTRSGTSYVFAGTGFGHGVGLCQAGALARARRGQSAEDILGDFFPGAVLGRAPRAGARIP